MLSDRLGDLKKLITEQEALSEKAETELSELLKKLQEQYETGTKAMGTVEVFKVSLDSLHEMGDGMYKFVEYKQSTVATLLHSKLSHLFFHWANPARAKARRKKGSSRRSKTRGWV